MRLGRLGVLLWKHAIVRRNKFIRTAAEIVSVFLFFLIVYLLKHHLQKNVQVARARDDSSTVVIPEPMSLRSAHSPTTIWYSPDTKDLHRFMGAVARKLKDTIPVNYEPLPKNMSLNRDLDTNSAVVIFQDFTGNEWPEVLNYTIRIKNDFGTATHTLIDGQPISHSAFVSITRQFKKTLPRNRLSSTVRSSVQNADDTTYDLFMKLQWAVDSTYLEFRAKEKFNKNLALRHNIMLQEFPYDWDEYDLAVHLIMYVLMNCSVFSLLFVFVNLLSQLLEERATGIQELLKMLGVSTNQLTLAHVINVSPISLVYSIGATIFLTLGPNPLLVNTHSFILFLVFLLYFYSIIAMAFIFSYIIRSSQYAVSFSVLTFIGLWVPAYYFSDTVPESQSVTLLFGILPNTPIVWFWNEVTSREFYGKKVDFSTIKEANAPGAGSVLAAILFMIFHIVVAFCLTWYFERVMPGKYGQALPCNFLCKRAYWRKKEMIPASIPEDEVEPIEHDPRYFEEPPSNLEAGIKVVNVTKVFPKHRALNNVSLEVYRGEVTVLLGHNGAGKTTLMSIITGMFSPTKGKVYVNGQEMTSHQTATARLNVGLCPQHNLFYRDLTVMEHVMFFTMLRGCSLAEARESTLKLLETLGLDDKRNSSSGQLSGGMKRRLQLACALAGDANVLILDEPTSGLDVETRRELWDLLLSLRGSRTVLLSTHFMEEADALGDRVAALHTGVLKCFATPMHLKRALGTGYRLTFTTVGLPREPAITAVIREFVPDATVKESSLNSLDYNLPSTSSGQFPRLFNALESRRSELGIDSIGVGVATLEEVFLNLCSDTTTSFTEDDDDDGRANEPQFKRFTGPILYLRQLIVLLKRHIFFTMSRKITFLIMQVILPLILIVMFTHITNEAEESKSNPPAAMDLRMYPRRDERVLYNVPWDIKPVIDRYPTIEFRKVKNASDVVLKASKKNRFEYSKYLVGIEVNSTHAKVSFNTVYRHTAPVALNLLANIVGARAGGTRLHTLNHPVTGDVPTNSGFTMPKNITDILFWTFFIVLVTLGWVLLLGSMATYAVAYLASFYFEENGTSTILIIMAIIFGIATPMVKEIEDVFDEGKTGWDMFLRLISWTVPPHTMMKGTMQAALTARRNAFCRLNKDYCPSLPVIDPYFKPALCCASADGRPYKFLSSESLAPGPTILCLGLQLVVLMSLVLVTQYGVFERWYDRMVNARYKPAAPAGADETTRAERLYVDKAIALPKNQIGDSMLVSDLHKNYKKIRRSCNAVKGISFSVKKGECFGILGVNGAGKSTTFKMLTGEICSTRGRLFANGHFLNTRNTEYLRSLGYCPQFFGVDDFMTGRQNLHTLLTLRGLRNADIRAETDSWIKIVGLEKYAKRAVGGYSGGCARRLATAACLSVGAPLTLLDEPTAGVDVSARRKVWAALRRALRAHRAVIITSHSMDEMEALCNRIAIMSAGEICALGSPAALRAAHAAGHAVVIKVRHQGDPSSMAQLNQLKSFFEQKFNCTLKDEHKTKLHYHINEAMQYSELFKEMEALKQAFPQLIEDYSVTETTLEEVFLSYARPH